MARPNRSRAPFPFLALPTELRLQIYNYLLLSAPTSYVYAHPDPPNPHLRQCRRRYQHVMLLANRQLHAEYAQAFYERTRFLFYINANNGTRPATTPFWTLPPGLLPNLRRCRVQVEIWELELEPDFSMEALVVRIEALLRCMERLRRVYLEWNLGVRLGRTVYEWLREWLMKVGLWERLGERFVQRLKGGAGMQEIIVKVGNCMICWERKGAEWVGGEVPYISRPL